jgi:5-methylthioadenosine/S-adenosylhomocysteine deaminase
MNDAGWTVDQACSAALRGATLLQPGRTGAADQRNLGDSEGQQGTANLEVIGRLAAMHLGLETPGARFHTAEGTALRGTTSPTASQWDLPQASSSLATLPTCRQLRAHEGEWVTPLLDRPPPRAAADVSVEGSSAGRRRRYYLPDLDGQGWVALMLVLQGPVVSMRDGAPASVPGSVYVNNDGLIEAVTPLDAEPAGFGGAPRVAAGGVIYPGLIDLHNHLLYNTLPLWTEPTRPTPWTSHTEWPNQAPSYQEKINDPAELLGKAAGRALLRYVETRAIIGATTAVQGNPNGTPLPDGDLVRNIDSERLGTNQDFIRVRTIVANNPAQLATYKTTVDQGRGFIYHLCEGNNPNLLEEYTLVEGVGLVHRLLIGIHGTALGQTQLAALAGVGATLVWSPFSNLWLYGQTAAIGTAKAAGLRLCLGSDWAPSGTTNVLWELKVADLWNRAQPQPLFTPEELCRLVTANPGDALAQVWPHPVGRLVAGAVADLVVVAQRNPDVYSNLIGATERDIRLVVVGGAARYGTATLMRQAGAAQATPISVAGRARRIDYGDPAVTWPSVKAALQAVRANPQAAAEGVRATLAVWASADLSLPNAPFILAPDMPSGHDDTLTAAAATAVPPVVRVPPIQPLTPTKTWFDAVDANPFHQGLLSALRGYAP